MKYGKTAFLQPVRVQNIVSAHYFEYTKDFAFSGELHDFWEIVYADKGEFYITADRKELLLKQGQMYLHKPLEFHNVRSDGKVASNSVILSFTCNSPVLLEIAGKILICGEHEKDLLAKLVTEAQNAYQSPLGDPYVYRLKRREKQEFACEQLIKIYLEELLITLVRKTEQKADTSALNAPKQRADDAKCKAICDFLEHRAEGTVSFSDVCQAFSISASSLKKLFHNKMASGVMEFFQQCKIDRAKQLIREETLNMTEIAERLQYSSIHYFSRHFKKMTGMTPSQYAASVKAMQQKSPPQG